eukprot:scaffold20485_cov61-Cyclotella_meneghiniana.AAC.1
MKGVDLPKKNVIMQANDAPSLLGGLSHVRPDCTASVLLVDSTIKVRPEQDTRATKNTKGRVKGLNVSALCRSDVVSMTHVFGAENFNCLKKRAKLVNQMHFWFVVVFEDSDGF